ncbi:MAG TPA: hypothetical protein VGG84_16330 [Gemmatimonadaceae bacterium]|jgi:hypothetical protein
MRDIRWFYAVTIALGTGAHASTVGAQSPADTAAVVDAIADALVAELQGKLGRGDHRGPVVFLANDDVPWSALITRAVRRRSPESVFIPATKADSAHALYLRITRLDWRPEQAAVEAEWSRCIRGTGEMNWWLNRLQYLIAHRASSWMFAGKSVMYFADGHCEPAEQ